MELITSRQNARIVRLCKLDDRKERQKNGLFRFDGVKLLEEAVKSGAPVSEVFCTEEQLKTVTSLVDEGAVKVFVVPDALFEKISDEHAPQGVITTCARLDNLHKNIIIYNNSVKIFGDDKVVFLESVRDPANLGAIIRSAAAFGVDRLVISRDCADVTNAKTIRASMGAVFYTAVDICDDLVSAIETYRSEGKRVFAAALDKTAVRLGDLDKKPGDAVIIGNEGHGLSDAVLSVATQKVYIPISERVESLNASVAAAILMWGIG